MALWCRRWEFGVGVHLVDEAAEGNHCKAAVLDLGELVSLQVGLVLSLAPDAVSAKPAQSYVGLLSMRRRFVLAVSFSIMYRGRPDINYKINKCGCSHGKYRHDDTAQTGYLGQAKRVKLEVAGGALALDGLEKSDTAENLGK